MTFKRSIQFGLLLTVMAVLAAACTQAELTKAVAATTKVQQVATKVASATTQPAVQFIETVAPQTTPLFGLVGMIATGVAGVATAGIGVLGAKLKTANATAADATTAAANATATAATATAATTQAQSSIGEIVSDIALYKQPGEKWTAATEQLLIDLGHVAAANV